MPAAERREQLLLASWELFLKQGYRETTTEQIACRAGLTKGALYHHFRCKEDLLYGLIKRATDDRLEVMKGALGDYNTPAEILDLLISSDKSWLRHDSENHYDIWIQAMRVPKVRKLLNRQFDKYLDTFVAVLGSEFGNKSQRRQLAVLAMSLFHGLQIRKTVYPACVNIPAQIKLFDKLVTASVGRSPKGQKEKITLFLL